MKIIKKSVELGKLHSKLWRYHDEQKWNDLNKTTYKFLSLLGYSKARVKMATPGIVNTFKEADRAYISQIGSNDKAEKLHYYKMAQYFINSYKILNIKTNPIKYKIGWIRASRHKNYVSVLLYLFLEYINMFGVSKVLTAILATQISITKVYTAHDKHDWDRLECALTEYWQLVINSYENKKKLPVQF